MAIKHPHMQHSESPTKLILRRERWHHITVYFSQIGCCGADGPSDYLQLLKPLPTECRDTVTGNAFFYGCVDELTWFLEDKSGWLAALALTVCFAHVSTNSLNAVQWLPNPLGLRYIPTLPHYSANRSVIKIPSYDYISRPGQSMWDLLWTKWHWDRFFSEFFGFTLSIYKSTYAVHIHIIWGMNNMSASGSSSET
jgi:hypothetical protein